MIDPEQFSRAFQDRYDGEPRVFSAPGRVNLIGEHTDYNDGFVMPFAIDRHTLVGLARRPDDLLNVYTLTLDKSAQIRPGKENLPTKSDWTTYIAGMAEVLRERGLQIGGADILIDSDIPFGAGLSSSAALETAVGKALSDMAGKTLEPRQLAFAGQTVEHKFVGLRSGIMDQFASGLSREGNAMLLDCRRLDVEYVPLGMGTAVLAVCDTRVKHDLATTAYNERREECEQAVKILSAKIPAATALRDVTPSAFQKLKALLPDRLRRRCRHVITENARTLAAAEALRSRDLNEVGRLMNLSHESLRDDYEVSCAELNLLADTAREIPNVYGARMTGGGFGGCTINLLEKSAFDGFESRIKIKYVAAFGREPTVFRVKASSGASQIR